MGILCHCLVSQFLMHISIFTPMSQYQYLCTVVTVYASALLFFPCHGNNAASIKCQGAHIFAFTVFSI